MYDSLYAGLLVRYAWGTLGATANYIIKLVLSDSGSDSLTYQYSDSSIYQPLPDTAFSAGCRPSENRLCLCPPSELAVETPDDAYCVKKSMAYLKETAETEAALQVFAMNISTACGRFCACFSRAIYTVSAAFYWPGSGLNVF
nr:hypothetical protein [Acetanaerobacterium elongatum]